MLASVGDYHEATACVDPSFENRSGVGVFEDDEIYVGRGRGGERLIELVLFNYDYEV